jgi:hypothetical protein
MDSTLTKLQVWQVWKGLRRLPVSAVCEDSRTAARVDEFCRSLSRDLGQDCEVSEEKWPVSELRLPQLRSIAAEEAARAGLIIVSVHHGQSLPEEMRGWIEMLLKRKRNHPIVLLALFDAVYEGDSTSLASYLKAIADRAKMEFVVKSEEAPQEE